MTENEFSYWAFLSYSQQDNCERRPEAPDVRSLCWGDWLREVLETFPVPAEFAGHLNAHGEIVPERIEPIFQDLEEQPGNARLSESTRKALEQSKCLIVICSPRSAKSLHVNEEVRYFKQLGRGNRVLPIVIAGEPNASDGSKPGVSPDEECFVPALRYPILPDGTLDTTQRDRGLIFADARLGRQGDDKREILAEDHQNIDTELEIAKIQLVAGVIGVGFNGLWAREQKRRFATAQTQVREARRQVQEARSQAQEAQKKFLEAQSQAQAALGQVQEIQNQVLEARKQAEEAQNRFLEAQHQVQAAQRQVKEIQDQIQEARQQAQAAQNRFLEAQNLDRAAQIQAQEAQKSVMEALNQAGEGPSQVQEAHRQIQEAWNQTREAQRKVLEAENQAREAQNQAQEAQKQTQEARNQAQAAQDKVLEAQNQAREAHSRVQEIQVQAQAARDQAQAAQNKLLEAQSQAQGAQGQAQEIQQQAQDARSQAQAAQSKLLEAQNQAREAHNQIQELLKQAQEARNQAQAAQNKLLEAQNQTRSAHHQVQEKEDQIQAARTQAQEAQNQAREAHNQVQEIQSQTRAAQSQIQAAQNRAREAQNQVQDILSKSLMAKRLTKVFAVLAVLALLAAGMATSVALRQRKLASQMVANTTPAAPAPAAPSELPAGKMDRDQIQQALQKISGAGQDDNRLRNLDELAARIPTEEISDALKLSAIISDDRQRCHFQKQLLVRLGAVDSLSAMASASAIEGRIVNDDGAGDTHAYFQLAVLDPWIKTDLPVALIWVRQLPDADVRQRALEKIVPALAADNPQNTLALLNDLKPAPGEQSYILLFQRWAANDPAQAIQQRQQIPNQDADDHVLRAILAVWMDKQPEAALNWVKSQPDSDAKNKALETCVWGQAKTDVPKALALADSLPEGAWRNTVIAGLFNGWAANDLEAATTACQRLPDGLAKEKAWEYVLNRRMEQDPASAADYVTKLPAGDYRQQAIEALGHRWAATNAPAVLAWAQALPSATERVAAMNLAVTNLARKDPQGAIQFAGQHPELSGEALSGIAAACAKSDLSAATNWVASLPDGEQKDAALLGLANATAGPAPQLAAAFCAQLTTTQPLPEQVQIIAHSLATQDVSNAVAWARGLQDEGTRQTALAALSETWAQHDPKGMATYALGLPAGDAQTQYLTAACRQLATRDLPGTVELLKPLSDAELRRGMLEQAVRGCDLPHMNEAAKYIAAMPAGDDQKAALKGLLASWAPADPESAVNWLRSFPETNAQTELAQSVIKSWSQPEPAAAAQWLAKLPAGTASDETISAFLAGAVVKYPEFAGQWTQSVTDPAKRQKFQVQVARQWMKADPAAALKWINTLDLPDDIKQPLKAQLP